MVGVEILLAVGQSKRDEFLQLADALRAASDEDRGCISRGLFERWAEPGSFLWLERWSDPVGLREHLRSNRHKALMGAIRVLGSIREVRFVTYEGASELDATEGIWRESIRETSQND